MNPECYIDNDELERFLQFLRENRFCHNHVESQGLKQVGTWKRAIMHIRSKMDSTQPSSEEIITSIEGKAPGITQPGKEDRALSGRTNTEMGVQSPRTSVQGRSRYLTPALEEYDTSRFNIISMPERPNDYKSSVTEIQRIMFTSLKKEERAEGLVYAYEVEGNKGFIKIGYITKPIQRRYYEWSLECNRRCLPIYPTSDLPAIP